MRKHFTWKDSGRLQCNSNKSWISLNQLKLDKEKTR